MNRFHKTEHNTYRKYLTISDIHYCIDVPNEIWNTVPHSRISDHIRYWKRNQNVTLKYGSVIRIDEIPTQNSHKCSLCNKNYKTRTGLLKHIKTKHSELKDPVVETSPSSEVTTQNITNHTINQTNNIQQNITILPYGKENPKWITEKVIIDALRNIPSAIMNLVREKHFNDKFPENRNVELCNEFRNRYVTLNEKSRKRIVDKKSMFRMMCNDACDTVTNTLESYSDPPDSEEDESPEDKRYRIVADRIRRSDYLSSVVDRYIHKWEYYVSNLELDDVLKEADHYITMLLLDLKLALAHEEETMNKREVLSDN